MTSEEFLQALERRQWLSPSLMGKLQSKVADSARSFDGKALAKFLVDKGQLTPQQAQELLNGAAIAAPSKAVTDDFPPPKAKKPKSTRQTVDLAEELGDSDLNAEQVLTSDKSSGRTRGRAAPKKKKGNEWDSPLLLIGGGALALLLLCGAAVGYFLFRESGDELLLNARNSMDGGSYAQAISLYEQFVESFPRHPDHSEARVSLAMARIRQQAEAKNFPLAYETAQKELSEVEKEEKFSTAERELAALLPKIAVGLATAAENEEKPADVDAKAKLAESALKLCTNSQYVPKSMRGPEIEEVQATLDRIARRQKALNELNAALAAMEQANNAGDTKSSYEAYEALLKSNPELTGNEKLLEMVALSSQAEQKGVEFVEETQAAVTTAAESPIVAELALADRRATGTAPATGVAAIQVEGVIYGVDVASGRLLWRRYVGVSANPILPVVVEGDLLCIDSAAQELVRLNQPRGELIWRVPLKEPVTQPVVAGKRVFLAGESGRLHVLDLASGNRLGYMKFAQPLRVPPVADSSGKHLYLAGDHSSLYTISVDDLKCLGVHYLGHNRGALAASPVVILNKLAVCENDGVETCQLHLYELNADAVISKHLIEKRLPGLVTQQPLLDGRRLIVATDRGQVNVYDITSVSDETALNLIASRDSTRQQPQTSTVNMAAGHLWVADNQLTKFSIDPTSTRIMAREVADNYANSTFVAPPLSFGDVLVHARKQRGDASVSITATDGKAGATIWETAVALRPAGSPAAAGNPRGLLQATAGGKVFLFDRNAIAARVQDTPLPSAAPPSTAKPLEFRHVLPDGRMVFSAKSSADVLLYDPAGGDTKSLSWIHLPSPLACEPTLFGAGWLAPLEIGQVLFLDSAGQPLAAPFQPTLKPGTVRNWLPAGITDDKQFVVTDGVEAIQLVEMQPTPQPHLAAAKEAALGATRIISRPAVIGGKVFSGAKDNRLAVFALPALEPGDPVSLSGEVTWGPFAVNDRVLLATANGKIVAVAADGAVAWEQDLKLVPLNAPLIQEGSALLSFADGQVLKLQLADGKEAARVELGQPLAAGATDFEQRFAATTNDGAVLIFTVP